MTKIIVKKVKKKIVLEKTSFEPDLNQRPKDIIANSTVLRSTNWAIEGTSLSMIKHYLFQYEARMETVACSKFHLNSCKRNGTERLLTMKICIKVGAVKARNSMFLDHLTTVNKMSKYWSK